jgi:hypothetical protein
MKVHCAICGEFVAEDRVKRGAVTCGQEHQRQLKNGAGISKP